MRFWVVLGMAAAGVWAQDPPAKPAPPKPARKLTPREKARDLLDSAAGMISAAEPELQAPALMHIADNYRELDPRKALEYFRQAFAATPGLPATVADDDRSTIQAHIAALTANLDAAAAAGMLRQIALAGKRDPRTPVLTRLVEQMIEKNQFDGALELVDTLGATGDYPYQAMSRILARLPADDPRRVAGFGSAMAAFANRPGLAFEELITVNWKQIPRALVASAVDSLVTWILNRKDEQESVQILTSAKGNLTLPSTKEADLFNVLFLLQDLDASRARDLLEKYTALRSALEQFPEGERSMGDSINKRILVGGADANSVAGAQRDAQSDNQAQAAVAAAQDDPAEAFRMAGQIEDPSLQARAVTGILATFADQLSKANEKELGEVSKLIQAMLDRLDDAEPQPRLNELPRLAEMAHSAKDDGLARRILAKAFEDCDRLLKRDTDAEHPNVALREYWPSTSYYRQVAAAATRILGMEAESMLPELKDTDVNLLVRIEVAQVLLGRGPTKEMIIWRTAGQGRCP